MAPEPIAPEPAETTTGPTVEDRIWTWVRIASEVVAVIWMIDIATHGEASRNLRYQWLHWKARQDWEKRFRIATKYVIFEAVRILEEASK